MPVLFSIDTKASKDFAAKLQQMKASAFPNAVRETLSKAALNVKQKTMPISAKKAFTERQKNFFKANSKVDFAKGKDIKTMQSEVGFISEKLKGNSNYAVKDLEAQEHGGQIQKKSFIPLDTARSGKSKSKLVQRKNILNNIKSIVRANPREKRGKKQAWVRAAIMAKKLFGQEAYVLGNMRNGKQTLSRINSISKIGRKISINRTPLYSFEKGRSVKASGTGFMKRASFETQSNMEQIFIQEAQKQLANITRRK